jgi:glycosyltransferase involved in cell wall biosynthesis
LPVITSNTSAIPESVGDAAILLDPHDKESLSLAMTKLNENEEMRQVLIAKGKVELQKRSWEKTVDIILNNLRNH